MEELTDGTAVPEDVDGALLDRLRDGDDGAYDELYRRHAPVVRRFALSMPRPGIDVDDVVAEVFLRVLRAVRAGYGPRDYVRTYLLTVVRRVLNEWTAARRDEPMHNEQLGERTPQQSDHQATHAEGELLARAFNLLPARWREVLWRMEVEGHRPASIAGQFGLTPNATAVLAHRARRGLRQAYLKAASTPTTGPRSVRPGTADRGCSSPPHTRR
jgi:RNA polymerase sigma factor (sigma-70 family)